MKKRVSLILAILMVAAMLVPAFFTVSAEGPAADDVCAIYDKDGDFLAYYKDIASAAAAAKTGETIKVIKDFTRSGAEYYFLINNGATNVTLDGDGHTYTYTGSEFSIYFEKFVDSTVKNLIIRATNGSKGISFRAGCGAMLFENVKIYADDNCVGSNTGAGVNATFKNCYFETGKSTVQFEKNAMNISMVNCTSYRPSNAQNSSCVFRLMANTTDNTLNIYGGYYYDAATTNPVINVLNTATVVNVYGGYFVSRLGKSLISNLGTVNIYGGTFHAEASGATLRAARATASGDLIDNADTGTYNVYGASYASTNAGDLGTSTTGMRINESRTLFYASDFDLPTMQAGASIRLVEGSNGIRFRSLIPKTLIDYVADIKDAGTEITYGTIIAPTSDLASGNVRTYTKECVAFAGGAYADIPATSKGMAVDEDGNVVISAALVNIKEGNITRNFGAISYLKYIKNGNEVMIYSTYDSTNCRSIQTVAKAALNDKTVSWTEAQEKILNSYANPS